MSLLSSLLTKPLRKLGDLELMLGKVTFKDKSKRKLVIFVQDDEAHPYFVDSPLSPITYDILSTSFTTLTRAVLHPSPIE
jgi:hypothetical protein